MVSGLYIWFSEGKNGLIFYHNFPTMCFLTTFFIFFLMFFYPVRFSIGNFIFATKNQPIVHKDQNKYFTWNPSLKNINKNTLWILNVIRL